MEEQILRFYLKVYSLLIIPIFYLFFILFVKEILIKDEFFLIKKNENYADIIDNNILGHPINLFFYKIYLKIILI